MRAATLREVPQHPNTLRDPRSVRPLTDGAGHPRRTVVAVVDRLLRPAKARALRPVSVALSARLGPAAPTTLTAVGLLAGVAAALAAAFGSFAPALGLWLLNRLLDGLDGEVARIAGSADDRGGYLDLVADRVVYAALPLGAAAGVGGAFGSPVLVDSPWTWPLAAALLASYYVNAATVDVLAALLEKRGEGAAAHGDATSLRMPSGLVEGTETVVLMSLMLAFPAHVPLWLGLTAALVALTAAQRSVWTARALTTPLRRRA